ncbi:MAG: response regulator [Nitrosomonas sp.]
MYRFQREISLPLTSSIFIILGFLFILDLYAPLGIWVWIFYFIPIVISFFSLQPNFPFLVTFLIAIFLFLGFELSLPGVEERIALINRSLALTSFLGLAILGNVFIRNQLQVKKHNWLIMGQNKLNSEMAGDLVLTELSNTILRFLVDYLEAQVGIIYINDREIFRHMSTYGVSVDTVLPDTINSEDGLIGQALKDNLPVILSDVPNDYLKIGSSLGKSSPRHLVIYPFVLNKKTNCIVELGFLNFHAQSARDLLDFVSRSIASAVQAAQTHLQVHELLIETQRQSEELHSYSEELDKQSESLKLSNAELEQQQKTVETANRQLKEQSRILINQNESLINANLALELQKQKLTQVSRYKSEFLANMSHELRTPLNSSIILAHLLTENRDGNLTDLQLKYAQTIENSSNELLSLINDILDLSKIEAGHMTVLPQRVDILEFVASMEAVFQPMSNQKGLHFRKEISDHAPESFITDPLRLGQVIKNLLSNAIKFTETGEVTLSVTTTPDAQVAFMVTDTGIGISVEQQSLIFEPFVQVDGALNRKNGGTGLGLSICLELIQLLKGNIKLESKVGYGSIFTVLLPPELDVPQRQPDIEFSPVISSTIEKSLFQPATSEISVGHSQLNQPGPYFLPKSTLNEPIILIVEDNHNFAGIIFDLATSFGFQGIIATTSEDASQQLQRHSPTLLIVNNQFKQDVEDALLDTDTPEIPLQLLSANDFSSNELTDGARNYSLKPFVHQKLMADFHRLQMKTRQKLAHVLIIEDDPIERTMIGVLLNSKNIETVEVGSVPECLEQLAKGTFDCMILDLGLPTTSGFSLLETLSTEDRYSFPPVIIYTCLELTADQELFLNKFSQSIIIKGTKSPDRLLDEVTLFLKSTGSLMAEREAVDQSNDLILDVSLEGKHLLIVEDDIRNIFALTSILEPRGATVQVARNGMDGLEALQASLEDGEELIDLVLMDIMMPKMDGLSAIRKIRQHPKLNEIPIIALTAKARQIDHDEALAAGANDYISKPLDTHKFIPLISKWLQ